MEEITRYTARKLALEVLAWAVALLFLIPFYFIAVNSVKSIGDLLTNAVAWPKSFHWSNFVRSWELIGFSKAFMNSLLITVLSNVGLIVISSMAAYRMVRRATRWNSLLFTVFVAAMIIPFESVMIPLVKVMGELGLTNNRFGLIVSYFGFGVSLNLFLYHGFIKSIPKEIEEAAVIDGCTPYGVFWRMIFPLLKPMSITIVLLNSLWIWNDFLLPLLVLFDPSIKTIPLSIYTFIGERTKQWDLVLPGLVMSIIPMLAFFLLMQKYIIAGVMSGSVKG
ncbi:carbohydrate ABC transporter permease [Paenibacillus paeoniae]|uniref:Carbohydrate ABC transporter permease n=1 Tax=Paenibacillus paeoniae TaxID=2292705 RepID=A0A371PFP9_9BACL|nr:carbohydrate ABC transporter permease [Paenibacillus paeoniae]REK74779.1 carbohydrate ABC transporter permease [Paenibacillus paeoniae]